MRSFVRHALPVAAPLKYALINCQNAILLLISLHSGSDLRFHVYQLLPDDRQSGNCVTTYFYRHLLAAFFPAIGEMRVIAGTYRSRPLGVPQGTRSASDLLRETLFDGLALRMEKAEDIRASARRLAARRCPRVFLLCLHLWRGDGRRRL